MLYHHGSRGYEEAASDAANHARQKLEGLIAQGRDRAGHVIDMVEKEVPSDYVIRAKKLHYDTDGADLLMSFKDQNNKEVVTGMHPHAVEQVAKLCGLPKKWVNEKLVGDDWERELLTHTFNEIFNHREQRQLVRVVNEETRGIMSDKFRRIDSRPIIESFANACSTYGAVPVEGYYLQTKVAIKALLPMVFEPVPNEIIAYGVVLQNSDYGLGTYSLRKILLRLWCTNYAIAEEMLRQVHLGKRLPDNISFSEKTHLLDTETMVSATTDIMEEAFNPNSVNALINAVKEAHETEISPTRIKEFLKAKLNKEETKQVTDAFMSPDVVNMPPGQSKLRLSNAISWIAGKTDNGQRKLEMQQIAGKLIAA
jgi:hypothetical protein